MTRRTIALLVLTATCLLLGGPAWADPAGPTHYRSTITGVQTASGEVTDVDLDLEILGGDTYFVVRAPAGSVVEIPGYEGEPYVRIESDGAIEVNQRSPARWENDARYGAMDVDVPQDADADAPPAWESAGTGGEYAWHDHRIHFMSPTLPSMVDPTFEAPQHVMDWEVPVTVDGEAIVVTGQLMWVAGPAPVGPIVGAVLFVAGLGVLVLRRPATLGPAMALGIVLTGAVGLTMSIGLPAGADTDPAVLVLPGMALVAVAAGAAIQRRGDGRGAWLRDAGGLPIGVWAVLQIGSLTRPIVPGPLPAEVVRVVTMLALAVGVVSLVALARRVLADTKLDPSADDGSPSGRAAPDAGHASA